MIYQGGGDHTENSGYWRDGCDCNSTTAIRMLWCLYFVVCFFFLYWPLNALSLLFGIFLKQKTATR
jgi:hypothetical protein